VLGLKAGESAHGLIKRCSSVYHSPIGLVGISLVGLQSQMFWGLIFQMLVLKGGVPDVGYKPFTPWEEALGFEFPPNCGSLCNGWGLQ